MRTQLLLCISAVILLSLPANMDLGFQDTKATLTESNYEVEFQADGKPTFTEEDYKRRIEGLSGEIEFSYNKTVRRHIQNYLRYAPHLTERLIGKTTIYFPVFEEALEASGLPADLKYLSVVESKLEPNVISPVGAGGLWQFMPETAREKGLTINQVVDERFDTHRSTEAAIAYLKELNELYDDWILAIAAYNCGPGRVNKAIRRSNSTNFWKLYPHLPKETRSYVPAFISVAYLMNYYSLHGLNPQFPDIDLQVTDTVHVYQKTKLADVANKCNVELETIKQLNAAYVYNVIPTNTQGYILTIPSSRMTAYKSQLFLEGLDPDQLEPFAQKDPILIPVDVEETAHVLYEVQNGETLWDVAKHYPNISVKEIIEENRLADLAAIKPGMQIRIPRT